MFVWRVRLLAVCCAHWWGVMAVQQACLQHTLPLCGWHSLPTPSSVRCTPPAQIATETPLTVGKADARSMAAAAAAAAVVHEATAAAVHERLVGLGGGGGVVWGGGGGGSAAATAMHTQAAAAALLVT